MLSDYFLEQCLVLLCSIEDRRAKEIIESINHVLEWTEKDTDNLSTIEFKKKFDLTKYISKYRSTHPNFNFNVMIQGMGEGIFKEDIPALKMKVMDISDDDLLPLIRMIREKRKFIQLVRHGTRVLRESLDKMDSGIYEDEEEANQDWQKMIANLHLSSMEINKEESVEQIASLDLRNDSFDTIMEKLRSSSDRSDSVKTGFPFLNEILPSGGFEPTRLYLIGGTSGVGKSTMLANLLANAVLNSTHKSDEKIPTFLYITAENLLDESLERLYCLMIGEPVSNIKYKYQDITFDLRPKLLEILNKSKTNVIMKYIQPRRTSVLDIEIMVQDVLSLGYDLKAVYIDYLDLLRSGYGLTELRHELGEISIGLKNLAVSYRIPVITVTQLNRSGYDREAEPSLTQMSESMQKIDNSDTVFFLQNDKEPIVMVPSKAGLAKQCKNVKLTVLKNRNGPTYMSANFLMQERMGNRNIFNFRMEEKPRLSESIDLFEEGENNKDKAGSSSSSPWGF